MITASRKNMILLCWLEGVKLVILTVIPDVLSLLKTNAGHCSVFKYSAVLYLYSVTTITKAVTLAVKCMDLFTQRHATSLS